MLGNHPLSPALVALARAREVVGLVLCCSGPFHPVAGLWKSHLGFSRLKFGNLVSHAGDWLYTKASSAEGAPSVSHVLAHRACCSSVLLGRSCRSPVLASFCPSNGA